MFCRGENRLYRLTNSIGKKNNLASPLSEFLGIVTIAVLLWFGAQLVVEEKALSSAIANATNNFNMNEENLYISKITVDEGPILKRVMPRAMGRADIIHKKTSHVTVVVSEKK